MANVEERPGSQTLTPGVTGRRVFSVTAATDIGDAIAAVQAWAAANNATIWEGLTLDTLGSKEIATNGGAVDITANYVPPEFVGFEAQAPPPTGTVTYSWNTRLENVRLTNSLSHTSYHSGQGDPPHKHDGVIGLRVDQDGVRHVDGVDVLRPIGDFSVTIRPAVAVVDQAYQVLSGSLVGAVSSLPFFGRAAGEVLFMGRSGSVRSTGDDYELRLDFAERKNVASATVNGIAGVTKDGWDYLNAVTTERALSNPNRLELDTVQVDVHRVYARADLNQLIV